MATSTTVALSRTPSATVTVDANTTYQTWDGWEASASIGEGDSDGGAIPPYAVWQTNALAAVADLRVDRLRLTLRCGNENSTDWWQEVLDSNITLTTYNNTYRFAVVDSNADANVLDPAGFHFTDADARVDVVITPYKALMAAEGITVKVNVCYTAFNPSGDKHSEPAKYARFLLAFFDHMDATYGWTPDSVEVILEPDNSSPVTFTGTHIGNCIVATAALLNANGYYPEFIAPSVEAPGNTTSYLADIDAVTGAAALVDEVCYHRYVSTPGTSSLAAIKTAAGSRRTSMLEKNDAADGWTLMGYLYDDLTSAQVSAWQQFSLAYPGPGTGQGVLVGVTNTTTGAILVTNTAKMLRHYYRYVRRGAVRCAATSSSTSVVKSVAFTNTTGYQVLVLHIVTVGEITVSGLAQGTYAVEHTTTTGTRTSLPNFTGTGARISPPAVGMVTIYGTH